jgi:hypothetical protein
MNAEKKAALVSELGRLRRSLLESEGCAGSVETVISVSLPANIIPMAPIPVPGFARLGRGMKVQNQVLERLIKMVEDIVQDS